MTAEFIISGGSIYTGTGVEAEAVAIQGGRITGVGKMAEIRQLAGAQTEAFDLEGRTLVPGFIDAHVHPLTGGMKLRSCSLYKCTDAASALEAVAAYARTNPDEPWVWGGGWNLSWFPGGTPDAAALDGVTGDRPAMLYMADGHGVWVNSAAFRLAGIDATTPDPPDGRIERLSDGSPQGTLHEGAMALVERLVPARSASHWEEALLEGQRYLHSCGVTGWQDADVAAEQHDAYLAMAGRGELKSSVVGATWWDRHRGIDQIDDIMGRRAVMAPAYRATAVKLMLDGIVENYTAALLDNYLDAEGQVTDNAGNDLIPREDLLEIVPALDRLGFHCHFHAIGDRAVRNALDAIGAARLLNPNSTARHHIAHIQLVDPSDRPRFAALGVAANAQPLWAAHEPQMDELTTPFLPGDRGDDQYPFASLASFGARIVMGSDWSVFSANVMKQIEVAVTRKSPYHRGKEPYAPQQSLTVEQSLEAFTRGSAWINGEEHEAGSIEVGKRADLVVLEADPRTETPIGDIAVHSTLVGGRVVYQHSVLA